LGIQSKRFSSSVGSNTECVVGTMGPVYRRFRNSARVKVRLSVTTSNGSEACKIFAQSRSGCVHLLIYHVTLPLYNTVFEAVVETQDHEAYCFRPTWFLSRKLHCLVLRKMHGPTLRIPPTSHRKQLTSKLPSKEGRVASKVCCFSKYRYPTFHPRIRQVIESCDDVNQSNLLLPISQPPLTHFDSSFQPTFYHVCHRSST
jgi:hypothetical protein